MKPLYALIVALIVASPLGLLAAGAAWGESPIEKGIHFPALMPDYGLSGMPEAFGYLISAVLGVALFTIAFKLLGLLKKDGAAKARG
jgi:cobalt/nickel transport system permease protein